LVVDAAVQIAFVRGRRAGALNLVLSHAKLITTSRAIEEAFKRIAFGMDRPDLLPAFARVGAVFSVVQLSEISDLLEIARTTLREAVDSRNGSERDDHILALAWALDADIWSPDRDFAGTGVASWSTPNLVRALTMA
jgi:hypothetical protein